MKYVILSSIMVVLFGTTASAGLNTVTYVDASGGAANNAGNEPGGMVEGVGTDVVTLFDIDGGDMWNGGDQFIYLHDATQVTGSFDATVRVVAQTEAVDGRWGKAGIRASASLDGNSANAMAQLASGNGSQPGGANPVPARLAGRTANDGNGGFENPIIDANGAEVPNDTFRSDGGVNKTWLRLRYDANTNNFHAGNALDVDGRPGEWSWSDSFDGVPADDDGWYVGLAYSVHNDIVPTRADMMHGVSFDNLWYIPEPASAQLALFGVLALLVARHRRR